MHLQVRLAPRSSPPDVEKVLGLVADAGINLVAVGGSDVEFGGELALVPEEGREDDLVEALKRYRPRVLLADDPESGLRLCVVDDTPGALHRCLRDVASENLERGRIIRDILVGVPDEDQQAAHQVPVHVYSEVVRTVASLG
ncbi:MAG TPA: hypothetical protein VIK65_12790 [Candidatus Limnocylindrales bacterium]|jgi:hypothetical protein